MKVFVLTEKALAEMIISIAEHTKTFPRAKRENYIETVMKHMAEYGAEAVLSYEEEQRIRRAERLIEGERSQSQCLRTASCPETALRP